MHVRSHFQEMDVQVSLPHKYIVGSGYYMSGSEKAGRDEEFAVFTRLFKGWSH